MLGVFEDWAGREKTSKSRLEFDKRVAAVNDWEWSEKEQKKGLAKPEMKVLERSDTKWVWIRKTAPVARRGPKIDPPADSTAFMKSFGLPGVEYGNWANDAEREYHITGANEALHDLAEVLGVPTTKIGMNSRLSVAFGARGSGGLRAPVAHYEPGRQVINITKLHGAGNIAHEWGHFLDHAITMAYQTGGKGKVEWLSEGGLNRQIPTEISEAMHKVMKTIKYQERTPEEKAQRAKRRAEIDSRMDELKAVINRTGKQFRFETQKEKDPDGTIRSSTRTVIKDDNYRQHMEAVEEHNGLVREWRGMSSGADDSPHYAAAKALAGGNYYCDDRELFARAFESWVEDDLSERGRRSGYLVQHTNLPHDENNPPGIYMEPGSEQRKNTNNAIRELVTILHKHDQFSKSLMAGLWLKVR
jgi:hypothetical protein